MSKAILINLIYSLNSHNKSILNELIDDNCLLVNYDSKAILSKTKVIDFLITINHKIKLINSVQDSEDTFLTAFSINDLFGSAIIQFSHNKINYLKIILVK